MLEENDASREFFICFFVISSVNDKFNFLNFSATRKIATVETTYRNYMIDKSDLTNILLLKNVISLKLN